MVMTLVFQQQTVDCRHGSHVEEILPRSCFQLVYLCPSVFLCETKFRYTSWDICLWRTLEIPHIFKHGKVPPLWGHFYIVLIDILEVACKCFISQVLQLVFFGLASVNDLLPVRKDSKVSLLCLGKDLLFSVFAFPVGMVSLDITRR